jgi:hypothetical protein
MPDAQKLFKAKELQSVCIVNAEGRQANLDKVLSLGLPTVNKLPARAGQLAIVASGPSVRDHLDELRAWPDEIWAINGAYDYLLGQGIVPHGFFAIDPLPDLVEYVERAHADTTFYVAATCDVSVFERLKGHKVLTFYPDAEDMKYPEGAGMIGGGTTALTRAPYLGLLQGWRDITLFGADSSYAGGEYCYEWGSYSTDIAQPKIWVEVGGNHYETEVGLMKQVSQMGVIMQKFNGMLKVKCGGLMDAFLKAPTMDDAIIEVETDDEAA